MQVEISPAQRRFLFQDQSGQYQSRYNIAFAIEIVGSIDVGSIKRAFHCLLRRHDILNVSFQERDGEYSQIIHDYREFEVLHPPANASAREIDTWFNALVTGPIDLSQFPLVRVGVLPMESGCRLGVVIPHILVDHFSLGILAEELSLYFSEGEAAVSALPMPIAFQEYSLEQNTISQTKEFAESLAYWNEALSSVSPMLPFRSLSDRTPEGRGGFFRKQISSSVLRSIDSFAQKQKTSAYNVFLAAYALLLSRYLSVNRFIVGIPVGDRDREEYEKTIGFLTNTVPIVCEVDVNTSFVSLVRSIQGQVADALDNKCVPFDRIVSQVSSERSDREQTLVQTMFGYSEGDSFPLVIPGCEVTVEVILGDFVRFPLGLRVERRGSEARILFEYDGAYFDQSSIERVSENFLAILEECLGADELSLGRLTLLSKAEMRELWHTMGAGAIHEIESDIRYLWEPFERKAKETPQAVAVIEGERSWTYAQLKNWSDAMTAGIRRVSDPLQDVIAVHCDRSVEYIVAILGVLKSGAGYLPLDPRQPIKRIEQILNDAGVRTVIASSLSNDLMKLSEITLLEIPALSEDAETITPKGGELAYVIYTSGSTGVPQGVEVAHAAVLNHVSWAHSNFGLSSTDHTLFRSPPQNDVSVWDIWVPLSSGAAVVVPDPHVYNEPGYICGLIKRHSVTNTSSVPAFLHQLLLEPECSSCDSLRFVTCGGEALSEALVQSFYKVLPDKKLYNCYGPTEATVNATAILCDPSRSVNIGKPIYNARVLPVDSCLRLVPQGVVGELCIGGAGVAERYRHNNKLTDSRFVHVTGPDGMAERMYRTGDLGRYTSDGEIVFYGRLDSQVKIRGYRIELSEVEQALKKLHGIRDAVASTVPENSGTLMLVAFVQMADGQLLKSSVLKRELGKNLPNYMIPSLIEELSELPRNSIGKVDRSALPNISMPTTAICSSQWGHGEEILAEIWKEVLGSYPESSGLNFFDVGGHSLKAMRLVALLKSRYAIKLPVSAVFESPHFSELSKKIEPFVEKSPKNQEVFL